MWPQGGPAVPSLGGAPGCGTRPTGGERSVVRPQGHRALGGVEDQLGVDLHLRFGNLPDRPLAGEGEWSWWRQPPQPLMGIPVALSATSAAGFGLASAAWVACG